MAKTPIKSAPKSKSSPVSKASSSHDFKPDAGVLALWKAACDVRLRAYAPYSNYGVGAALETESGEVFTGCNVENANYCGGVCAERSAVLKAVSEGHKAFHRVAVVVDSPKRIVCCGFCLQVFAEFCDPDFEIWVGTPRKITERYTLSQLLPVPFTPRELT